MNEYKIQIKNRELTVNIVRKKVKNINLRVTPNKEIFISANKKIPFNVISKFIEKKADWIYKKISYFEQFNTSNNEMTFESGESFLYLGKQYRIKVEQNINNDAKLIGKYLNISVRDKSNIKMKNQIVNDWYFEKANLHYQISIHKLYQKFKKYGYEKPYLRIKKMKTRWGSYSKKTNTININIDLIKTPKYCVEYVLLHELIHMRFQKHNKDFYYFLTVLMPDWEKRRGFLNEFVFKIL